MTRWARSGNTQKHKKMPSEATPWNEFAKGNVNRHYKNQGKRTYRNTNFNDKPVQPSDYDKMSNAVNIVNDLNSSFPEQSCKKQKTHDLNSDDIEDRGKNSFSEQNYKTNSETCVQNNKFESTSLQKEIGENESKEKNVINQKKCKGNFNEFKNKTDDNINNASEAKVYNDKKRTYMKKFRKNQAEDIIRKDERNFRKKSNTYKPFRTCFNCRKRGHGLADCPVKLGSSYQETGICFKCGSVEHTSFKCTSDVQGFPFAKCFICKEQGHISRDCPSNEHGVYPKGGRCNLCGNVNHLKKDCPILQKKNEKESCITLSTINQVSSIDEEIAEAPKKHAKYSSKVKKIKIVHF